MVRFARLLVSVAIIAFSSSLVLTACGSGTPEPPDSGEMNGDVDGKVIYGDDNRHELYQEKDPVMKALADSTVVLLETASVGPEVNGFREVKGTSFKSQYSLCADEPFGAQIASGFCSGFLVSPNTIATAGHCIRDAQTCSTTLFAFGYWYKAPNGDPRRLAASEVYKCKQILRREENSASADFAIIQLDRAVTGHTPLPLRKSGKVANGEPLVVMGYPSGLPLKIADGAQVRDTNPPKHFVANLDTYGGNSGSAVFNTATKVVEGILVRGEQDFVLDPKGCARSNKCGPNTCRGEDVTKIAEALPYIPGYRPVPRKK
ncbi:MAG: serine protease [Bdellovibrionota bacterium]